MHCSTFSAFAACTFNCQMVDLLRNQDEIPDWKAPGFKCKQQKIETWKVQC